MGVSDIVEGPEVNYNELMDELPIVFAADLSDEEPDEEDEWSDVESIQLAEEDERDMAELVEHYESMERRERNNRLYNTVLRSDLSNSVRYLFDSSMTELRIKRYFDSQCDFIHLKAQFDLYGHDIINLDAVMVKMVIAVFYSKDAQSVIHENCYEGLLPGEDKDDYVTGHYLINRNKKDLVVGMLGSNQHLYFCDSCGYGLIEEYFSYDDTILYWLHIVENKKRRVDNMSDELGYSLYISNLNDVSVVSVDE
nr:NS3 [Mute swan feces associated ambidensovirus 4]